LEHDSSYEYNRSLFCAALHRREKWKKKVITSLILKNPTLLLSYYRSKRIIFLWPITFLAAQASFPERKKIQA
jgi:hypothetical protein